MLLIGTIIGALIGFWLGGIYGALAGAVLGQGVDYFISSRPKHTDVDFAIKVIALGAKMAKADGVVTPDEIAAFKEYFQIQDSEVKDVAKVFNMAKKDIHGYEEYARQLVKLVNNDKKVLDSILDGLFYIANADDILHPDEQKFLQKVAEIFGMSEADFQNVLAYHAKEMIDNPYECLGVSPTISDDELVAHHRSLVRDHHPDVLTGKGLPEAIIAQRSKKLQRINAAFDTLKKSRGMG